MIDYKKILSEGVTITSSGTTGDPKAIYRSPENLKAVVEVAIDAQRITKTSKILTVTRITHAGGLLTQSLPAYTLGAEVKIQQFNAYTFLKDFENYTHTFLAPAQMTALMNTKNFQTANLTGKWILGGSDPVSWEMIEEFVKRGAIVQPNWGMSEVGPITINTVFDSIEKVYEYKSRNNPGTILGDTYYCETKIVDGVLYVKGPTCYISSWLKTNDIVVADGNALYYQGRVK
jgi:acyl-CoA synthetase (AMP-forming)/AMP-acid ligase II